MSYVDSILEPGEAVRYRTTISWTVYGPAFWLGLASFAIARGYIARWSTEIAVTDRRIIFKRGLIRRHTVEMNMQKVESVDVDQTLLGRLFNYGDVTVRGVGSTFERLNFIDAPLRLRTTVTAG